MTVYSHFVESLFTTSGICLPGKRSASPKDTLADDLVVVLWRERNRVVASTTGAGTVHSLVVTGPGHISVL